MVAPRQLFVAARSIGHGHILETILFLSENLRLRAEVLLLILRIIVNSPIFHVKLAKVLVVVGVVVIVEGIHPLVCLVKQRSTLMLNEIEAALVENTADLDGVQVLQSVEINLRQQVQLLIGER